MMYLLPWAGTMVGKPYWFGVLTSPRGGGVWAGVKEGRAWAMDNNAFTSGFDPVLYFPALERYLPYVDTCLFVALPDVVGNAATTMELWEAWRPLVEHYPAAFVAQDGQDPRRIPECDVLFIGGTNEFKLGKGSVECINEGHRRGIPVHVGRVNSKSRLFKFWELGCSSADGTYVKFGPDINYRKLNSWMRCHGHYFGKKRMETARVSSGECRIAAAGDATTDGDGVCESERGGGGIGVV